MSEEQKAKISKANTGKKRTTEQRQRMAQCHIGKKLPPFTEEHKRKLSESNKGQIPWTFGKHLSEETKRKISISNTGKAVPKERIEKQVRTIKEAYKNGRVHHNKGKKWSKEVRENMSRSQRGNQAGEKSHFWKGGITPIVKLVRTSSKYIRWRQRVFLRDNFVCQECGQKGGSLSAHHIKSFSDLIKEAREASPLFDLYQACMAYTPMWRINNGKTLCHKCHSKTKSYGGGK